MRCRHCQAPLEHVFIDLGHQPASNAYLTKADLERPEVYAPLKAYVCSDCWLVQLPAHHRAEDLFTSQYAYFSSISGTWIAHARHYVSSMINRLRLNSRSLVVEVAANDGYLLQFVREAGVPCYGIEPTASTAAVARAKGIEIIEEFFGTLVARNLAETKGFADLIVANNVLAHVPDINDFVAGFRELLSPDGVATFEFPHVLKLIEGCQFDTIYHEHYSYLSLSAVKHIFERQGLDIFDVDEIETHGGSLRIYCCRQDNSKKCIDPRVEQMIERERDAGLLDLRYYSSLGRRAEIVKLELLAFLVDQKRKGIAVAAYGAAAKGNTLLNFTGVKRDLLPFVCDAAPSKQGRFLPGSHVPILPPSAIKERRPEFILILPWNLRKEIVEDLHYVRDWGAKFVLALPQLEVI